MAQQAFIFSSDAKTLGILNQIFEELGVTCEQTDDLIVATKKITSETFDAILIDCDDLKIATQIFAILRGSTLNQTAISAAIVDGKAGVPTAFRLGAKTVLSKPLSLEQARGTLRNAMALQRRDTHDKENKAAVAASSAPQSTSSSSSHEQEPAAEATAFRSFNASKAPTDTPAVPTLEPAVAVSSQGAAAAPARVTSGVAPAQPVSKLELTKPRKTAEISAQKPLQPGQPAKQEALVSKPAAMNHATPTFSMLGEAPTKSNRKLIPLVAVVLVVGGGIAVWFTQPGIRNAITGGRHVNMPAVPPAPVPAATETPQPSAVATSQTSTETASSEPQATPAPATASSATSSAAPAPAQGQLAQGFQDVISDSGNSASDATAPIIVAENISAKHIVHRVAPWYPTRARRAHVKGTVVLTTNVAADGSVESTAVRNGNPLLTLSAQEAVKQWQFQPYFQNGQAVAFQTQSTVIFPPGKP